MKKLLLIILFGTTQSTLSLVNGYTRLYRADIDQTIDIVHDNHIVENGLSQEDMSVLPIDKIKPKLFSSEQRFLEVLESLDKSSQTGEIAFIGESRGDHNYGIPLFIDHTERLVAQRLNTIKFIHADNWRRDKRGLIDFLMLGKSPLYLIDNDAIIKHSGLPAWDALANLITQSTEAITNYFTALELSEGRKQEMLFHFKRHPLQVKELIFVEYYLHNPDFWALCDIEIISHILSTPHKRIIVYAGWWHVANITDFLTNKACYQLIETYSNSTISPEAHPEILNPLDGGTVPAWAKISPATHGDS